MASNMNTMNDDKLKIAAENGDINLLYRVIQEEPQVRDQFDMAETPLHIAASAGHLQFATEIIRLKPSFAWKLNQQGFSPIHLAMQQCQKQMVLRFVDINKDLVRVKGREGLTPLHFASQTGEVDLLANFLTACPDSIEDVTVRGETALHIAVKNQQYEALQVLLGWLKRTRHRGAMELGKLILNSKDEAGNTILHISALINDSQALRLLVETNMDLNAKNLENFTALDIAANAEIESILFKAGAKHGSSVTDAPTLADTLKLKITMMDKILIYILRIRSDITEEQRNAFLIVAALVATSTYQLALSPPSGVFQANAGDNIVNTTSLNSTANATQGNVGKSVMSEGKLYMRLQGNAKNSEIKTRNSTGGNRW
ncbi:PGG domain [Sesbania bispinosa]|nr:PGG domain [Sesbania bispinosa]